MNTHINQPNLGLWILRLVVGGIFLYHGITKFNGIEGVVGFFGSLGFSPFLAYLVATIETVGGALLILGFFPRIISALFVMIMLVAIFRVKGADFTKAELDVTLLFASAAVFFLGAGAYVPAFAKKLNNGKYLK